MCPSHFALTALIVATTPYVLVDAVASSCTVLPVICESILLLYPFSVRCTLGVKCHASDPYTKREHTPVLYIRSFSFTGIVLAPQICRSLPAVCSAIAILTRTSCIWSPSARICDPKYFIVHTFSSFLSSQVIVTLLLCNCFCFATRVSLSTAVPLHCRSGWVRVMCDLSVRAYL